MIRFISFVVVAASGFAGPVWFFLAAAAIYGFWFSGLELVIVAMCIDAFFGNPEHAVPIYTSMAVLWLIVMELVKPHLLLYNQDH